MIAVKPAGNDLDKISDRLISVTSRLNLAAEVIHQCDGPANPREQGLSGDAILVINESIDELKALQIVVETLAHAHKHAHNREVANG